MWALPVLKGYLAWNVRHKGYIYHRPAFAKATAGKAWLSASGKGSAKTSHTHFTAALCTITHITLFLMVRILLVVVCISFFHCGNSQSFSDSSKIDRLIRSQIELLDQCLKYYENVNLDTVDVSATSFQRQLVREQKTIDLFEILTGIEAPRFNAYAYGKIVDRRTADLWIAWIAEHRNLLIWESMRDTINRSDKDIYLYGLPK